MLNLTAKDVSLLRKSRSSAVPVDVTSVGPRDIVAETSTNHSSALDSFPTQTDFWAEKPAAEQACTGSHSCYRHAFTDAVSQKRVTELAHRVTQATGLSLNRIPSVCTPSLDTFPVAVLIDKHDLSNQAIASNVNAFTQNVLRGVGAMHSDSAAAYLFGSNQIVLSEAKLKYLTEELYFKGVPYFSIDSGVKDLLTHELTHAVQAQHYPHLMKKHLGLKLMESLLVSNPLTRPLDCLLLTAAATREALTRIFFPRVDVNKLLLEGHARYYERRLSAQSKFIRHESWQPHRQLVGSSWRHFPTLTSLASLRKSIYDFPHQAYYDVGSQIVSDICQLQEKLEGAPFINSQGEMVEMCPTLRGNGLLDHVMRHPEELNKVLPKLHTHWLLSSRLEIDTTALRDWVVDQDGHLELFYDASDQNAVEPLT